MHSLALETDIKWLRTLGKKIWQNLTDPVSGKEWSRSTRQLTSAELRRIKRVIVRHGLPCEMYCDGFGPGMSIYTHPAYPGLEPEGLLNIMHDHLPHLPDNRGGKAWRRAWDILSPLTHSPRNHELLSLYGFKAPQEYGDYIY